MTACEVCQKGQATVHVTEIVGLSTAADEPYGLAEKHLCDSCAQAVNLPHMPVTKKVPNIWKLLQQSAQRSAQESNVRCPDCGLSLADFRSKGRLGCPKDYEIFRQHLDPLLERIHNACEHVGRTPGIGEAELDRRRAITDLREKLREAIREEAYESAARLRDELERLEATSGPE